jgi:hypothetical protein
LGNRGLPVCRQRVGPSGEVYSMVR